jgi:hypothetical protein
MILDSEIFRLRRCASYITHGVLLECGASLAEDQACLSTVFVPARYHRLVGRLACWLSSRLRHALRWQETPPLISRSSLRPMAHDFLRFLVVDFCERVVSLTVRVQQLVEFRL